MTRRRVAAALGLACLLALSGCGVAGDSFGGGTPERTLTPVPVPTDSPTPRQTPAPSPVARAVGGGGIDPWAAADAHAATLEGESYTLTLTRESRGYYDGQSGTTTTTTRLTTRVANATTYRVDRAARDPNGTWTNRTVAYADGRRLHRQGPNGTVRSGPVEYSRGDEGPIADRSEEVLARYLAVRTVSVIDYPDEGARFLLRGRGAPPNSDVEGYRVGALIRADGRVTALRAAWRQNDRLVVVTYRLESGNASAEPPAWEVPRSTPTVTPGEGGGGNGDPLGGDIGDSGSGDAWDWPDWASEAALGPRPGDGNLTLDG